MTRNEPTPRTPPLHELDDWALDEVARYFKALSEPSRLKLLNALREGEHNVSELTEMSGTTQANASRHLTLLAALGVVERENRGTSCYYRIADPSVYELCDLVCGQLGKRFAAEKEAHRTFLGAPTRPRSRAGAKAAREP
jgi:DNA-binding transcriptional ArsR family regulator